MSSKYQFVTVCAAGWCLEGIQEISGGNLHLHRILNGCWWLWFSVDVKLKKQYFIYLPGKGRLSEQVSKCQSACRAKVSHESQAFKFKLSCNSDLI